MRARTPAVGLSKLFRLIRFRIALASGYSLLAANEFFIRLSIKPGGTLSCIEPVDYTTARRDESR
jgi:hypothetical protein